MPISPNIPQCEHIKLNGVRCGSPSLKGKNLCYFHFRAHDRHAKYIPFLEDGNALQFALMQIIRGVMDDRIDLKKANTLLYALQIAGSNLRQVHSEPYWENVIRQFPWHEILKKRIRRAEIGERSASDSFEASVVKGR
ncbi:MAG: hypothetical protein LAN37_08870 [Acidobacteriia bacterium]|nr:hypothetical protein [Terriglobia bacterium]